MEIKRRAGGECKLIGVLNKPEMFLQTSLFCQKCSLLTSNVYWSASPQARRPKDQGPVVYADFTGVTLTILR